MRSRQRRRPPRRRKSKRSKSPARVCRRRTLESTSPISVIGAQDIKWDGITNTADIINQLPSAFADYGSNLSNGASGTATVNLRNLGANRTLVLIDGKRVAGGQPDALGHRP